MAGSISGKLLKFTIGSVVIRCQTDGNITITKDVTTDDPCKDDEGWTTGTVTSKAWTASFGAKSFLDSIAMNQLDIIDIMLASDEPAEIEFLTTPGDHNFPIDVVLAGEAYLNNFSWDAPANATSTYTVDLTGNGPLVKTEIPVVVTP
jgi:hypothetical protein